MSYKIYEAYRCEIPLEEALHWLHEVYIPIVEVQAVNYWRELARSVPGESVKERLRAVHVKWDSERRKKYPANDWGIGHFGFDLQFHIFGLNRKWYFIPIAGHLLNWRENSKPLTNSGKFKEFYWFNNADRPEEVSSREWKARAKVWREIDDKGWRSFTLNISSQENFYTIDPAYKVAWGDPKYQNLITLWNSPLEEVTSP